MNSAQRGSAGRIFTVVLVVLLLTGLGAAVVYLLSDINARRYRFVAQENMLVVEKGRKLPFGFEPFVPEAESLQAAYAPLPMPPGEALAEGEIFDDQADMDRALFALLAGWSRTAMRSEEAPDLSRASTYIERSLLLPGLSEQQRRELRTLRADLAYRRGRLLVAQAIARLNEASEEMQRSLSLGTSRATDAADWIRTLRKRVEDLQQGPMPQLQPPAPPEAQPDNTRQPEPPAPPTPAPTPQPPSGQQEQSAPKPEAEKPAEEAL